MICILIPCYVLQHTDDVASLFLSFLSSPQSHSPLLFPPFPPSAPLSYYLKITGVIAQLEQISKLGLITFLSTSPFRPIFLPIGSTSGGPFFLRVTVSVRMLHSMPQFSKPHRCREGPFTLCVSAHVCTN